MISVLFDFLQTLELISQFHFLQAVLSTAETPTASSRSLQFAKNINSAWLQKIFIPHHRGNFTWDHHPPPWIFCICKELMTLPPLRNFHKVRQRPPNPCILELEHSKLPTTQPAWRTLLVYTNVTPCLMHDSRSRKGTVFVPKQGEKTCKGTD